MKDEKKSKAALIEELREMRTRAAALELEITASQQTEDASQRSETSFQRLFKRHSSVMLLIEPESGRIVNANAAAALFYGHSEADLNKMTIQEINQFDSEKVALLLHQAASESCNTFIFTHKRKNGELRTVEVHSSPIEHTGQDLLFSIIHDITERKRAEEKLLKQQYFLQKAQELGSIGSWELDIEKNELLWTDGNYRIFGLPLGSKLTYETFLSCVHPEDREYVDTQWKAAFNKKAYDIEHRLLVDGAVKWVREKAEIEFNEEDECIRGIGFTQDITQHKQAEEKLHSNLRRWDQAEATGRIGTWEFEVAGGHIWGSPNAFAIYGIPLDAKENPEQLLPLDRVEACIVERERVHAALVNLLVKNEPYRMEYAVITEEQGDELTISSRAERIDDEEGNPILVIGTIRDVTEDRRKERAQRESDARFRLLADQISDVIWSTDLEQRITYITPSVESLLGYSPDEMIGEPVAVLFTSESTEIMVRVLGEEISRDGGPDVSPDRNRVLPFEQLRKDGSVVPVEITTSFLRDNRGVIQGLVGVIRDITDRQRAEEQLRNSQEMLKLVINNIPQAVFWKDRESRFLGCNTALTRYLGVTHPRDIIGKTDHDLLVPEEEADAYQQDDRQVRDTGVAKLQIEERLTTPDGVERRLSTNKVPLRDSEGEIIGILATFDDVTERFRAKEERERLMLAIEQVGEAVIITDTEGAIQYVNPAFESITGYTRAEVIGQNPRLLKSGEQDDAFYKEMWETLTRGEVWHGRLINKKKEGALFTEEATISPVRNPAGKTINYVAVKRDITQEIALEAQLLQAQKMEAVGRLAGGVAHDFNNVLCAIIGNANLVLDDLSAADPLRESMEEITKAADRAADLTRQLLAFSRKQVIDPKVIDLSRVIESLHSMLIRLIGEDIILRTVPQKRLGRVRVDSGQIEQIVLNLAVNARDAMPEGGELIIETADVVLDEDYCSQHAKATPGAHVMLAVNDTGCGMSAEIREKIFEPFFTTKQLGQGTGLGLAMVFGIVDQNGGRIEVESESGKGTSFKVYFPRVFDEIETPRIAYSPEHADGTETVLVVEDEEIVRKLAVRLLKRRGYKVLATNSGDDAILLAERHDGPIHLLLTDVVMPHMNGRDLAERLTKTRPGIKVLYTSGYTQDVIAHHGVLDEGVQFIAKPYSLATLATRVREVLDRE